MSETKTWAIFVVILCTFLTSAAQIFLKYGSNVLRFDMVSLFTNYNLIAGIVLYMLGAMLLIVAFSGGEVTALYPIFATSYVWVLILSYFFLGESLNIFKILAIFIIISGIYLVTYGSRKKDKTLQYVDVV